MAIAKLHITPEEFYELTVIEFKYAMKVIQDEELAQYKTKYEVARYLARHIWNSAGVLKKLFDEPKDVGLFGWEIQKEQRELLHKHQTVDQMKRQLLRIAKRFKAKKREPQ